ncbi:MAG: DUF1735 domain-containing protein [Bacteroidota bacterium]
MKLNLLLLLVFTVIVSSTGCIKDSDNIQFVPLQNPGIGFPFGANNKNDFIIRPGTSAQQVSGLLFVNLEAADPAASDIRITVADNSAALVNAYNAANGTAIQPLPRSLWSIPAEIIIKKGERNAQADITIASTTGLNFNAQYAIGLRIASADGGNKIADNLSNLFVVFRIQNILDGRYNMRGEFTHPGSSPIFTPHNFNVELHTSGPNSVLVYWHTNSYSVPLPPTAPICCFVSQELSFFLNPVTNAIVCANTAVGGAVYYDQFGPYNGNTYNNRWDPATKTVYAAWGYNLLPGGIFAPNISRAWIDTLTYLGPR